MSRLFEAEVFVKVVDENSFTAAARRLDITRSYASKRVTRLEDRLGVRLLRVTLPTAFGMSYLTEPLAAFKALHPALTLEAVFTDRHVDLLAEGFDVAIREGELPATQLITHRLATADMFVCASNDYLRRRGTPRKPEDLAHHECLLYAYHAAPGTWKLHGPRGAGSVQVEGTLVANHARMLLEAASQGLGLSFMPVFHTVPYLRDGRLRRGAAHPLAGHGPPASEGGAPRGSRTPR